MTARTWAFLPLNLLLSGVTDSLLPLISPVLCCQDEVACTPMCPALVHTLLWSCCSLLLHPPGWLHSHYLPGFRRHLGFVPVTSLCAPSPCLLWRQALSASVLASGEVWLQRPGQSGLRLSCCFSSCCKKMEMSATSTLGEIWRQMTLFASKKNQMAFWGGGEPPTHSIFYLEHLKHGWPWGHRWPKAGGIGRPPASYNLVLSLWSFISYTTLPSSYFFPHSIDLLILPLSFLVHLMLSARSGGLSRNWWWCRGWMAAPLSGNLSTGAVCFNSNCIWRSLDVACMVQFMPRSPPLHHTPTFNLPAKPQPWSHAWT